MDELDWKVIAPIMAAMAAIWMVYFKREEILSLRHKDFTTKLDSTIRFFKEFYKNPNEKKLVLDRAAQDIAKLNFVDFKSMNYLVTLHEHELLNFDEMIDLYRRGKKFIDYDPNCKIVSAESFKLKLKNNKSVKFHIIKYNVEYSITAFFFLFPLFFSDWFLTTLNINKAPLSVWVLVVFYFIGMLILAVSSLFNSSDMRDAEKFIEKLIKANIEYEKIQNIEIIESSVLFSIPFTKIKIIRQ